MRVTNRAGLPEAIVRAVQNDPYRKGEGVDYSVTELLKPPQSTALIRGHEDELEEDAVDRLWSLFGSAVHHIIERSGGGEHAVTELRLFDKIDDLTISGKFDHYDSDVLDLNDFKCTSVWTRVFGSSDGDWEAQLNMLAYLCAKNSMPVSTAAIIAIYRDHNQRDLDKDARGNYPKAPVERIDFPLWSTKKVLAYIRKRLRLHEDARHAVESGQEPAECSPGERWWDERKRRSNRCEKYCKAFPWCHQAQSEARECGEDL